MKPIGFLHNPKGYVHGVSDPLPVHAFRVHYSSIPRKKHAKDVTVQATCHTLALRDAFKRWGLEHGGGRYHTQRLTKGGAPIGPLVQFDVEWTPLAKARVVR